MCYILSLLFLSSLSLPLSGQEGGQAGAPGQEDDRTLDVAQVKTPKRAGELDRVPDLGVFSQIRGQGAVFGISDEEANATAERG